MKKRKLLYGILLAGCMIQFFTMLFLVFIVPIPVQLTAVISLMTGAVTLSVVSLIFKAMEIIPQDRENRAMAEMIYDLTKKLNDYKDGWNDAIAERDGLSKELTSKSKEAESFQQSARQMQGWIDNFPCQITPQFKLYNLFETELVTGAYSRWLIPGEENGMLFSVEIIRQDNQNKIELFRALQNIQTKEDILKFDMARELFNPELQAA